MVFGPSDRKALLLLVATLSVAPTAAGQEVEGASSPRAQLQLDYQPNASLADCPTQPELSASIAQRLGYDPFIDANPESPRLRITIERATSGTEARIVWLDAQGHQEGERRLGSTRSDCSELASGLAFAVAVQIQLRGAAPPPAPAPPPPPAKPERPPPRRQERTRVVMVGAGIVGSHGLTPGFAPGVRVFGSIGNDLGAVEVSTQATLPTEQTQADNVGFSARELSGRIAPCLGLAFARTCAVGMLGQLLVRGEGVDRVESPSSLVAGAGVRLQLVWPALPSLGAIAQVEALALFTPRTIQLNREDVWSTAPVVVSASVDLAAILR